MVTKRRPKIEKSCLIELNEAKRFVDFIEEKLKYNLRIKYKSGERGALYKRAVITVLYYHYKEISSADLVIDIFQASPSMRASEYVNKHNSLIEYDAEYKRIYERVVKYFDNYLQSTT